MKHIQFFIAALLTFCTAFSQAPAPRSFISDSLDNYINAAMKDWQIPGVAVCIVKDGKVAYMKGYGVKDMNGTDKIDENTLFMIGSNTKAFTATALAMLHSKYAANNQSDKFSLDDKVQKWLPDFKMYDPWVTKEANIRDLLCHRLGFETFQGDFMYFDSDLTPTEVREKMGKVKPMNSFRSKWGYANCAFLTAGEIIPKVTGKSWAQFITEEIFVPLEMNNSIALTKDIDTAHNKAAAHTVVRGELRKIPYGHIDNLAPAGSISSSVNDMSKWVMAQLNNGKLYNKEVFSQGAIMQTRTPHSIMGNGGHYFNKGHFALYGLGWMLSEYAGRKIVSHTGGVNGFVTSVCLIPEEKLGIIVLTNTDANNFYEALRNEIEDAYLGLPYRNYSKFLLSYNSANEQKEIKEYKAIRDSIAQNPVAELPIMQYAGNYVHEVYGKMYIKPEDGKLVMRFEHHKGRYGILEPLGGNRFFCTYSDPIYGTKVLNFTVANKKVKSLTVEVSDFVEPFPYEFKKIK